MKELDYSPFGNIEKLQTAIHATVVVALMNEQGDILEANEFLSNISQYSQSELRGRSYSLTNAAFSAQLWRGELRSTRKDGSSYWLAVTVSPYSLEKGQYLLVGVDITKQKQLEDLAKNSEIHQIITENTTELFALIDRKGLFHFMSPSFTTLLAYDAATMEAMNFFTQIHPEERTSVKEEITSYCSRTIKKALKLEFRIAHQLGHYRTVEADIVSINNPLSAEGDVILLSMRDIQERKEVERTIYRLAFYDALTNLPNRRSFMTKLRSEMTEGKGAFAILLININDFEAINEQRGHENGDLVLKETAKLIQRAVSPNDEVAHLGGDEFVILLRDVKEEQIIVQKLQQLVAKFESPLGIAGHDYDLTIGIGVATYPEHGSSPEHLMNNANTALRHIKGQREHGKSDFMLFNRTMENQSLERRLLESALKKGIKEQQFYLEYQPKINMVTNELFGMEALVRWNHPDLGIISPAKFIPLAEETGLIVPLGEWILRESCRQAKGWQEQGYPPLVLSVNVSIRQLVESEFIRKLEVVLQETGLAPELLELEVTESVLADIKNTVDILKEIRKRGVQISIDDFGTGYSSLSYIKELPIDTLKVDQSFVKDIHVNGESKAIAQAIIHLANSVGLNVIAEGVELKEHVEELSKGGYVLGQGYYYSKPLKVEAFEHFIKK